MSDDDTVRATEIFRLGVHLKWGEVMVANADDDDREGQLACSSRQGVLELLQVVPHTGGQDHQQEVAVLHL